MALRFDRRVSSSQCTPLLRSACILCICVKKLGEFTDCFSGTRYDLELVGVYTSTPEVSGAIQAHVQAMYCWCTFLAVLDGTLIHPLPKIPRLHLRCSGPTEWPVLSGQPVSSSNLPFLAPRSDGRPKQPPRVPPTLDFGKPLVVVTVKALLPIRLQTIRLVDICPTIRRYVPDPLRVLVQPRPPLHPLCWRAID